MRIQYTGKGDELERIISIPIYKNDDYSSIIVRFLKEFNDADILDVLPYIKYEDLGGKITKITNI